MTRLRQWLKISKIKRCMPVNESESVEQRRQNIIEKRRRRNAMNPARIEEIISAMTGAAVRMDEYYAKNRFAIYISSIPSMVDEESVRKKIKLIKQSHKVFDIFYEQATKGDIRGGMIIWKNSILQKQVLNMLH